MYLLPPKYEIECSHFYKKNVSLQLHKKKKMCVKKKI